jgi:hypothetical protein
MSTARPGTAILGAIAATLFALWLSYAVAAGLLQSARPASDATQTPQAAPIGLALTPAPELRIRPALGEHAAEARTIARPVASAPAPGRATAPPAKSAPPPAATSAPPPAAMSAPPAPAATTPAPDPPAQQAPPPKSTPKPAARPRPTPAARPTKPASPDFDDASPSGFDTAG